MHHRRRQPRPPVLGRISRGIVVISESTMSVLNFVSNSSHVLGWLTVALKTEKDVSHRLPLG